jgi:hypothetical protein
VRSNEEKRKALDIIMEHYSDKSSFEYPLEAVNSTAIIKRDKFRVAKRRNSIILFQNPSS